MRHMCNFWKLIANSRHLPNQFNLCKAAKINRADNLQDDQMCSNHNKGLTEISPLSDH